MVHSPLEAGMFRVCGNRESGEQKPPEYVGQHFGRYAVLGVTGSEESVSGTA